MIGTAEQRSPSGCPWPGGEQVEFDRSAVMFLGKLTTWEAVENPEPKEAKRYTAAPIQSYAVPFAGANSIFGVFHG